MNIKIERAVCDDCGNYVDDLELVFRGEDGTLLCTGCMKKFIAEDFESAMEWHQTAVQARGRRFARKVTDEERAVMPRAV